MLTTLTCKVGAALSIGSGSFLARARNGDVVYLIAEGTKRPFKDQISLAVLGLDLADIREVSVWFLDQLDTGSPIEARFPDGAFIKTGDPEIFQMDDGLRHWVPDPDTFKALGGDLATTHRIGDAAMNEIPKGTDLPSVNEQLVRKLRRAALSNAAFIARGIAIAVAGGAIVYLLFR